MEVRPGQLKGQKPEKLNASKCFPARYFGMSASCHEQLTHRQQKQLYSITSWAA
jgi:hypothetical protein